MSEKLMVFLFILICVVGVIFVFVSKGLPAETDEDYIAIMNQAENWPVEETSTAIGTLGKFHQDPANSDRVMMTIWFPNRANNNQFEKFAKIYFLRSSQKKGQLNNSLAAMLKMEDGTWKIGDYIRTAEARYNGEKTVAFRLFKESDPYNPIAIRVFLLKDLMPNE